MTSPTAAATDQITRLQSRVEALERERRQLLALLDLLREITGSLHYLDIVQTVARRVGNTFGLDRCSVFLAERGGGAVHLVASFEDPGIRNHVVDVSRYPELRRALESGEVVHIPDATSDPTLAGVFAILTSRRVQSITVVPIAWRGVSIGAIFLRTFRDGPALAEQEVEFCRVVAEITAQALRYAHHVERLRARNGGGAALAAEKERAAMLGFLRRFLFAFSDRDGTRDEGLLARASTAELDRLVDVALTVLTNEAQSK
ncbi:MAG TPA: GAF domain-containing protein [Gemmatimonadales bacterium]|jgi:two-component system cell cycle response regulator|nr:GAF domain-containing protein [Gemmatimonadales bacterium]